MRPHPQPSSFHRSSLRAAAAAAVVSFAAVGATASPATADALSPASGTATASPIKINEVESNGDAVGDWVEVVNTSDSATDIDVSDYTLVDNDPDHAPVKLSTLEKVDPGKDLTLESGEYLALYTDQTDDGFGLGGDDSVTLADAAGDTVDTTAWTKHAATTWGRLPDATGDFAATGKPTPGAANVASGGGADDRTTRAWPYPTGKTTAALPGVDLGEDSSGVDFDSHGNAYLVNNGTGELLKLAYDERRARYAIADVWNLNYANGSGTPDAEGVTVKDDDTVYVGTERDNDADTVSRPSVLEYDLPDGGGTVSKPQALDAAREWDLKSDVGTVGANSGIEAVEWLPDVMGGVFAVGVEGTSDVLFEKLNADGTSSLQKRWNSPTKGVMALDYQPSTGELLVLADDADAGLSVSLTFDGSTIKTPTDDAGNVLLNEAPTGMADYADEGFARYVASAPCPGGSGSVTSYRYLWADDNDTSGIGLRQAVATSGRCASASPTATGAPSSTPARPSTAPSSAPGNPDGSPSATPGGAGSDPRAGGDLPRTGADLVVAAGLGLLLVVGGATALVLGRRRG